MEEDNSTVEERADETKNHKKISGTVILAVFIAFVLLGYALFKNEAYQNYKNDDIPEKARQGLSKDTLTTNDNAQPNETTNQKEYAKTNMSALSAEEKAKQIPPPEKIEPYKINSLGGG